MRRPARHGPARWLQRPDGVARVDPVRRRDGAFAVTGPEPLLAGGRVLVDELPGGPTIALPSIYAAHLAAAVVSLRAVMVVGDARDLPWPLRDLSLGLGSLPDHAPVPHDWLDGPREAGWRVAAPWQMDVGALGYGRWLPAPLVSGGLARDEDHRHLLGRPQHVIDALHWHGVRAEPAGPGLLEDLLGWTAPLPNAPVVRTWSEDALT